MFAGSLELDAIGIAWRLGATLFFVILNGFFVAAEFALVKVSATRIAELSKRGQRSASTVTHILKHMDLYLSGCQLGITLASLALGALGEPAVSKLLLAAAAAAGLDVSTSVVSIASIALAFAVITILHMTLGEQAPKMWALRNAESTSLSTAGTLRLFTLVLKPFIILVNNISNWMLRVVGLPESSHDGDVPTVEELRSILSLSARAGHISGKEHDIAQNLFRLIDLEVRHIMVPRNDVQYLAIEDGLEENLEMLRKSSHSRFPVCEYDLDDIIGFVHGKDVLEKLIANEQVDLQTLAREPLFVPDTMALNDLLREMQTKKVHLSAVVDEHGTVIGLAFREDALEEIVGPLGDEFDQDVPEFNQVKPGQWEVRGRMPFPDFCARLDIQADDESEETVGGYVVARLGRMPRQGDAITVGEYAMQVKEIARRRITKIAVTSKPPELAED